MKLQDKNKSKAIVLSVLLGIFMLQTSFVSLPAQPGMSQSGKSKGGKNYAVLISQPNHIKAVVSTAGSITPDSKYKREAFVVMACGKSVEAFVKGSEFTEMIQEGKAAGITYKICGLSLQQFSINPDSLIEGIEIVPNGLTYIFDLQTNGYKTVEL